MVKQTRCISGGLSVLKNNIDKAMGVYFWLYFVARYEVSLNHKEPLIFEQWTPSDIGFFLGFTPFLQRSTQPSKSLDELSDFELDLNSFSPSTRRRGSLRGTFRIFGSGEGVQGHCSRTTPVFLLCSRNVNPRSRLRY